MINDTIKLSLLFRKFMIKYNRESNTFSEIENRNENENENERKKKQMKNPSEQTIKWNLFSHC